MMQKCKRKKWLATVFTLIFMVAMFSGCNEILKNKIITSSGHIFDATDYGLQQAILDVSSGGTVFLPPLIIIIDRMFYITQDNLNIIGCSYGSVRTTLNFVNHTVWFDPNCDIDSWRAVPPGTINPASRTANFSMKSMDFYKCKNLYLEDIVFTGAANVRFVIEQNFNLHLRNVDFYDIDRPFTHHGDYGSWPCCPAIELDYGSTIGGGVLVENCDIHRSTNWGWVPFARETATIENVTFRNCTAYRCGLPLNGVEIIEVNPNGKNESNNWQNWSIGFGLMECYWALPSDVPTSRNFLYDNCTSEENRESGFHSEYAAIKDNIQFKNCKSNRNGQKWIILGYDYGYNPYPPYETYCSGFLNFPDDRYAVSMVNCQANDNFLYGYAGEGYLGYLLQMINCTATGNGIRDYF